MPEPIPIGAPEKYAAPPAWFDQALEDAERLLKYAAETGVGVDDAVRNGVLEARAAAGRWDEETAAKMLAALTKLAAQLKPVTAESLRAYAGDNRRKVRNYYWTAAILLVAVITPFSVFSFASSAIAARIRDDVTSANTLAVKLRAELGSPGSPPTKAVDPNDAGVIGDLQEYASTIRGIYRQAQELDVFILKWEHDPIGDEIKQSSRSKVLELPADLSNLAQAANDRTLHYQEVRYFAQSVLGDEAVFYGSLTSCVLPVLYALLGTCAFLLRSFERQITTRTFMGSGSGDWARFLIGVIGGAVVGLFNNFTFGQGASIPPLALAFLVGYAVDVFFAFLEGILQQVTHGPAQKG
jgi:hypothetical protein